MQKTILSCIKDSVQEYAAVISTVLGMDVDIVDERLIRMAGTNRFESGIGAPIDGEGNAFKWVLEHGETLLVEYPGADEVCATCPLCGRCPEQYEICCPIVLGDRIIGVISLAVFEEEQRQVLLQKKAPYRSFLEQIANLIAAKAAEYNSGRAHLFAIELQKELLSHISDGVVVFDDAHNLLRMNQKAEQVLGNTFAQLTYLSKIRQFSIKRAREKRTDSQTEYVVKMREKKLSLVGSEYPLLVEGEQKGGVFVFQDVTMLTRALLSFQNEDGRTLDGLIGQAPAFVEVREAARVLAYRDVNILVSGETGSGKEALARAIHNESRREGLFVSLTSDGSAESLFEHAFWDARVGAAENEKVNHLHMTNGGTLFIDEIGNLPLHRQSRLMEMMHDREAGCVRFIASTSKDLEAQMKRGGFRQDLYYSFMPTALRMPSLRDRPGDVRLLVECFLERYSRLEGKHVRFHEDVFALFEEGFWPGNVRELEQLVGLCVSTQFCDRTLKADDLPQTVRNQLAAGSRSGNGLDEMEKQAIVRMLNTFGSSVKSKRRVAQELGISMATLYRKLHKYQIDERTKYRISSAK